jgi:threonylcarbamoyladenosine tRNA methylthiotransferase MtaB
MRVNLQMLGCRLNEAELQGWARDFTAAGHEVVPASTGADLVVFNTCAVTREAARKSRQQIRRARRQSPGARLVVTGCYGTLQPDEAAALLGVDRVVSNRDKDRLVDLLNPRPPRNVRPQVVAGPAARNRDRAFVKVQDGCRYRCAYCVVTLARGEERSRPVADVVAEVAALHAAGVNEVVLTGVHVGGYGEDLGESLTGLVATLLRDTWMPRLRLASLEPWALTEPFFELFTDPRLMPHLHLPLQSGSDAVLRRMARRCRRDDFLALVARARAAVPGINLTTDVITGFPGESDDDWRRTVDLVEEVAFGDLHVFPFSPQPGTRAATMPDPVPVPARDARASELLEVGARLRRCTLERQVGRCVPVLLEGGAGDQSGAVGGYTPEYLRVVLDRPLDTRSRGAIRQVRLTGVTSAGRALTGHVMTGDA